MAFRSSIGGESRSGWAGSQSRGEKKLESRTAEAHGATARTSGSLCERNTPTSSVRLPSRFPSASELRWSSVRGNDMRLVRVPSL